MAKLSVSEAARAAGVARSTIYEKLKDGELSRDADKKIDTVELMRVFGELVGDASPETGQQSQEVKLERTAHALWLQELADRQQDQIERLQKAIERQAEQLREAEERATTERLGLLSQLDRLAMLLPAPAPPPAPLPESEPPARSGFFARVFG